MKKAVLLILLSVIISSACSGMGESPKMNEKNEKEAKSTAKYAIFDTSMGKITCVLYPDRAPKTVANFIGLATGTKEWKHPLTGEVSKKPLYSGTIFHRVIPNFMVQGGDPLGSGYGGPGYQFEDEFDDGLKFAGPGRLAMANSGPNTNGSQFFITTVPTPWLNDKHTIFGQVIDGQEIVEAISNVKTTPSNKPLEDVVIRQIFIQDTP